MQNRNQQLWPMPPPGRRPARLKQERGGTKALELVNTVQLFMPPSCSLRGFDFAWCLPCLRSSVALLCHGARASCPARATLP
jgi:hypothetical protein